MDGTLRKRPIPSGEKFRSYITIKDEEAMLRYEAQLREARKNPALPMPTFEWPQEEMLRSALRRLETNIPANVPANLPPLKSLHKFKKVEVPLSKAQRGGDDEVKKSES